MNKTILVVAIIVLLSTSVYFYKDIFKQYLFLPRDVPILDKGNQGTSNNEYESVDVQVVAEHLDIPWELAFLPNGDILVTERVGRLLKIGKENKLIKEIDGVKHIGEGGLLGMALHPKFSLNNYIYLYFTYQDSGQIKNKVERYVIKNDTLSEKTTIVDGLLGSSNHDGGRIAFGPDGYLYITVGDAEKSKLAQDKSSLNGKILRVKDDGTLPTDNPFGNAVYSYGHRNPQGIAWDNDGNLWATEHGPSGTQTGNDEVNLIVKGGNYGWPSIKGTKTKEGMISPIIESTTKNTWAPAGIIYLNGNLYFAGLRGSSLYKAEIEQDNKLKLSALFKNEFGRLRTIVIGPDKFVYITTSNKDGRGTPKEGDDKIIKINPDILDN